MTDHRRAVLRFVAENGRVTVPEAAVALGMHSLHVARHLGQLADEGLLDRHAGRVFRYDVTYLGRRYLAGVVGPVPVHPALQPQHMTAEQVADLVDRVRTSEHAAMSKGAKDRWSRHRAKRAT